MKPSTLFRAACAAGACLLGGLAAAADLGTAERHDLDTFFSNFSEARVESFAPPGPSDAAMLDFALTHNYLNRLAHLERSADGLAVTVTASQVDRVTSRYFGRTLPAQPDAPYRLPLADGDPIPFSQVGTLVELGDGRLRAEGVIYMPDGPGPIDVHANPKTWPEQGEDAHEAGRFSAVIEQVKGGSGARYILREYTLQ